MPTARLALLTDLHAILTLFARSEVSSAVEPYERAEEIWRRTIDSDSLAVFVAGPETLVVATCTLIMAPNLLRSGRQHGFLENVVTDPDSRGLGYGRAVVHAALSHAWSANCHHVLMQSGKTDPRVHAFYEGLGFRPGLRIGYVAVRPQDQAAYGSFPAG
jgi:ribosomal protein S18 acetylase RimI-like enzyme